GASCPSVIWIFSTWRSRRGSLFCCHAGLWVSTYDMPGSYSLIWYGPLEIVFCRNSAESGTYRSYSWGAAAVYGSVSRWRKSLAGCFSRQEIGRAAWRGGG